jgi:hypothetical protein
MMPETGFANPLILLVTKLALLAGKAAGAFILPWVGVDAARPLKCLTRQSREQNRRGLPDAGCAMMLVQA